MGLRRGDLITLRTLRQDAVRRTDTPLLHSDEQLIEALSRVFEAASAPRERDLPAFGLCGSTWTDDSDQGELRLVVVGVDPGDVAANVQRDL